MSWFLSYSSEIPWAHVRHPIYLAGLFLNLGTSILIGTTLLLLQSVGYALFEVLIDAPHEEHNLREVFSIEYDEYSKRVPSWIPITLSSIFKSQTAYGPRTGQEL